MLIDPFIKACIAVRFILPFVWPSAVMSLVSVQTNCFDPAVF